MGRGTTLIAVLAIAACKRPESITSDDATAPVATDADGLLATLDEITAESRLVALGPRDSGKEQISVNRVGPAPPRRCRPDDAACVWRFDGWVIGEPVAIGPRPVFRCTMSAVTGGHTCEQRPSWHEPALGEFDAVATAKSLDVADKPACGARTVAHVYFQPAGTVARVEVPGAAIIPPAAVACIRAKLSTARVRAFAVPRVPEIGVGFFTH